MGNAFATTSDLEEIARSSQSDSEEDRNSENDSDTEDNINSSESDCEECATCEVNAKKSSCETCNDPDVPDIVHNVDQGCEYSDTEDSLEDSEGNSSDSELVDSEDPDGDVSNKPHHTQLINSCNNYNACTNSTNLLIGYIKFNNVEKVKELFDAVVNRCNIKRITTVLENAFHDEHLDVFCWVLNNTRLKVSRNMIEIKQLWVNILPDNNKVSNYLKKVQKGIEDHDMQPSESYINDLCNIYAYAVYHNQNDMLKSIINYVTPHNVHFKGVNPHHLYCKIVRMEAFTELQHDHICAAEIIHTLIAQTNTVGLYQLNATNRELYKNYLDDLYKKHVRVAKNTPNTNAN
jgi:hypothetical protein